MSNRERVEAEAREQYPADDHTEAKALVSDFAHVARGAFIAGRTVTAGQMEAVNDAVIDAMIKYGPDGHVDGYEEISTAAAKAAGLLIEGEDDE